MLRPYIGCLRPYNDCLRPHIGCSPEHPASRKNRCRRLSQLRFVLFREWSFSEPNVEARPTLNGPELDDSGRSAIDHIHERL